MVWFLHYCVSLNAIVNVKHLMEIFLTSMVVNMLLVPDSVVAMSVMVFILIVLMMFFMMVIMVISVVSIMRSDVKAMVHWLIELMMSVLLMPVQVVITIVMR